MTSESRIQALELMKVLRQIRRVSWTARTTEFSKQTQESIKCQEICYQGKGKGKGKGKSVFV